MTWYCHNSSTVDCFTILKYVLNTFDFKLMVQELDRPNEFLQQARFQLLLGMHLESFRDSDF